MFNKLGTVWNARTPVYMHNRTKENIIFQLTLTAGVITAWYAWDAYKERRDARKNKVHLVSI